MTRAAALAAALADRYRIERELGAGGMATVYLAHDIKHDRDVAIKLVHPDLGAALGGERFLTEIRTTARLQHPHILPLLESGNAGGRGVVYVENRFAELAVKMKSERPGDRPAHRAGRPLQHRARTRRRRHGHRVPRARREA